MDRDRSLRYLRVLGVEHYVPRRALPGAAPHPVYASAKRSRRAPAPAPASGTPAVRAIGGAAASPPVRHFRLELHLRGELLLVDSLPALGGEGADYRRLLENVLFACSGGLCADEGDAALSLNWPPPTAPAGIRVGERAAIDYVAAKIEGQAWLDRPKVVLLLGESANRFFRADAVGRGRWRCFEASEFSIGYLLREPGAKERFQEKILPLLRRCTAAAQSPPSVV